MPAVGTPKPKLGKGKLAGKPVLLIGGVLAAIVIGLYLRSKLSGTSTASPTTSGVPATADTSGGAGSSAATPSDLTPFSDLANAITGLTYQLGGGGSVFPIGSSAGGDPNATATPAAAPSSVSDSFNTTTTNNTTTNNAAPSTPAPAAQAPTYTSPENESAANAAAATIAALGPPVVSTYSGGPYTPYTPATISALSQEIPSPPTHAATNITPAPKPAPPPSGYSQKSKANLH